MAGFDDLEDAVEEQDAERDVDDASNEPAEPEPETSESSGGLDEPAFPYEDVKQGPIYPRAESWTDFEDALALEITPYLHQEGVRNAEKREIHDAMVQLAVENPEELAEKVIDARESNE